MWGLGYLGYYNTPSYSCLFGKVLEEQPKTLNHKTSGFGVPLLIEILLAMILMF